MTSRLTKPKAVPQKETEKKVAEYFATHCAMVFSLLPFVRSDDRKILYKWLEKFRQSNETEADRTNRNDYIWFMLIQMESGTVTFPFTGPPPKGELIPLLQFMPKPLYIKIMKAANLKLLDYEEAMKKISRDPCPLPTPEPRKPCPLKKKGILKRTEEPREQPPPPETIEEVVEEAAKEAAAETAAEVIEDTTGVSVPRQSKRPSIVEHTCPLQQECPQISKQTICPEPTCPLSPWSKPSALFTKPPKLHTLKPGERRIPLYEEAIKKCKPSDFLYSQPRPKRGFIAYGSCFSDQMNMLI